MEEITLRMSPSNAVLTRLILCTLIGCVTLTYQKTSFMDSNGHAALHMITSVPLVTQLKSLLHSPSAHQKSLPSLKNPSQMHPSTFKPSV